jgi:hypothetical protein
MKLPLLGYGMMATSRVKAFVMDAVMLSILAAFTLFAHDWMEQTGYFVEGKESGSNWRFKGVYFYLVLIGTTFIIGLATLGLLYLLFDYGGGMLATPSNLRSVTKSGNQDWIAKRLYGVNWCDAARSCRKQKRAARTRTKTKTKTKTKGK